MNQMQWLWTYPGLGALCAAIAVALLIDWVLGEPPARWHPVVAMGRYLSWAGRWVAPSGADTQRRGRDFAAGMVAWLIGALAVCALAAWMQSLAARLPDVLAWCVLGLFLKPLLAWRMLRDEVQAVEQALASSLSAGRERVAHLVSRDVQTLDASEVRQSALSSLAENLNDSVVAPLFWFLIGGLPAAALYRWANTADAMWGYPGQWRGQYWAWAGKWAARADDVLSWLPARLTAILLLSLRPCGCLAELWRTARSTPSPNGGWPMGALALALGLRLEKPGVYRLNPEGRPPQACDTAAALRLCQSVVWGLAVAAVLVTVLLSGFEGRV